MMALFTCRQVEVRQRGPLGYAVRVDGAHDGLVYRDDIFDAPPKVPSLYIYIISLYIM